MITLSVKLITLGGSGLFLFCQKDAQKEILPFFIDFLFFLQYFCVKGGEEMYVLQQMGKYRVEVYNMDVLGLEVLVSIDLKIFGKGPHEFYIADYAITRISNGKTTFGSCLNQPTKEATIQSVKAIVIRTMQNPDKRKWE